MPRPGRLATLVVYANDRLEAYDAAALVTAVDRFVDDLSNWYVRRSRRRFSLERVSRTGAIFDHAKLDWYNGIYIRSLSPAELARRMRPFLGPEAPGADDPTLTAVTTLVQDRLRTLSDARDLTSYFFTEALDCDRSLLVQRGAGREQTLATLERSADVARQIPSFRQEDLERATRALADELGMKTSDIFMSTRVACTGRTATPPLFQTMEALGRQRVVRRLREAAARLRGRAS
ncbi:MAG: hypothetical protein GEU73_10680 [Chloroflexi bacterium]|nr:hypothetical protein [Chloroflexota bacterium]